MQFNKNVARAKDTREPFKHGLRFTGLLVDACERAFVASRKTDEALRVGGKLFVSGERIFGFAGFVVAQFGARDEPTQVLIAGLVFGEEGETVMFGGVDLGADESADAEFFGGLMEARCAVNAVGVGDGHGGLVEMRAAGGQVFGQGRGFEEREG